MRLNADEAMKHPWILELKKKTSKEVRPKHRLRREAETSVEHENNRKLPFLMLPFLFFFLFLGINLVYFLLVRTKIIFFKYQ